MGDAAESIKSQDKVQRIADGALADVVGADHKRVQIEELPRRFDLIPWKFAHSGDDDRSVQHHEHPQRVSSIIGRKRPGAVGGGQRKS